MKKVLRIVKIVVLTSFIFLVPITACSKVDKNYTNISNININTINIAVTLNKDYYNKALQDFKEIVANKINKLLIKGKTAKYAVDYEIAINNHDKYDQIKEFELLDINVFATSTTHILKGNFKAKVNLVPVRKDISNINIAKQEEKIEINNTTFGEAIALHILSLVQEQINILVPNAKQDNDYVVNVEGHVLSEYITTFDPVNINVTAVEDNYHFLLHGSFSFILAFN